MKKKIYAVMLAGALLLSPAMFSSCALFEDAEQDCHDDGGVWCDDDEGCCGADTPWSDGHGSCYNTLSYCRETGWACSACY